MFTCLQSCCRYCCCCCCCCCCFCVAILGQFGKLNLNIEIGCFPVTWTEIEFVPYKNSNFSWANVIKSDLNFDTAKTLYSNLLEAIKHLMQLSWNQVVYHVFEQKMMFGLNISRHKLDGLAVNHSDHFHS